jgi:hypothetical protein
LLGRDPGEIGGPVEHEAFERVETLAHADLGETLGVSMIAVGEAFTKIASNPVVYGSAEPNDPPSQRLNSFVQEHRLRICWAGHEGLGGGSQGSQNRH